MGGYVFCQVLVVAVSTIVSAINVVYVNFPETSLASRFSGYTANLVRGYDVRMLKRREYSITSLSH